MIRVFQEFGAGRRQVGGAVQTQAVAAEEDDRVLRVRKFLRDLAIALQVGHGLDLVTIGIADGVFGKAFELGVARVGYDQGRAAVGSLLDTQIPDGRFFI